MLVDDLKAGALGEALDGGNAAACPNPCRRRRWLPTTCEGTQHLVF